MAFIITAILGIVVVILWAVVKQQQKTIVQHTKWLGHLESEIKKSKTGGVETTS